MKKIFPLILILISCSPSEAEDYQNLAPRWTSAEIGHYSVWFQDWSDYTRLVVIENQDTVKIEPSKYAVRIQKKPHLYPKEFEIVIKRQMIGNINWIESPNWTNGVSNSFRWTVDRANPKINLPKSLTGTAKMIDGKLHLNISENSNQLFNLILRPLTVY